MRYVEGQREQLGTSYGKPAINKLPTTLEELRELLHEYEQMTEEEQQEVDSILMIQAMINSSMNGMIEAQANYQYTAGMQQWNIQLEALNEDVHNSTYNVKISKLEKQKLELLAQLQALQNYYEIRALQVDLRAAQFEAQTTQEEGKDTQKLIQLGLSTHKELEQVNQLNYEHKQRINSIELQIDEKLKLLRHTLGIKDDVTILLPSIDEMKLAQSDNIMSIDYKKQLDYIIAEEATRHAMARLENAKSKEQLLVDYIHTVLIVEVEKRMIIEQWIKQKINVSAAQEKELWQEIKELEYQLEMTTVKLHDYEKLLLLGKVSEKELEVVNQELDRLAFALEKSELALLVWQEEQRIAALGVLP